MLPVQRQQMIAYLLHPLGRCQRILAAIKTEMPAGNDQFIDLSRREVLEQLGHIVIDAMPFEVAGLDQFFKVSQATKIDTKFDSWIEGSQLPGTGRAHREAERSDAGGINFRPLR